MGLITILDDIGARVNFFGDELSTPVHIPPIDIFSFVGMVSPECFTRRFPDMGHEKSNDALAKVKARIRALTEKTVSNGCTEAEAMAAAEAVGRLLDTYNLSMAEVDLRDEPTKTVTVKHRGVRRTPADHCLMAIAEFCDAKVFTWTTWVKSKARKGYTKALAEVRFFGLESDAELAAYLYEVIARSIETETRAYARNPLRRRGAGRSATTSFGHGMAGRVRDRLRALKAEMNAAATATPRGTDLVVLKGQIIEDTFADLSRKLGLKDIETTTKVTDETAYRSGQKAGDKVNLSRPMKTDAKGPLLLVKG